MIIIDQIIENTKIVTKNNAVFNINTPKYFINEIINNSENWYKENTEN